MTKHRKTFAPPAFMPVPVRPRHDGWTPQRQATFLGALAETGAVSAAAQRVGLSRESAYRLRGHRHAASFAAAWDTILGPDKMPSRKFTGAAPYQRVAHCLLQPVMRSGRHVGTQEKHDNPALWRAIVQFRRGRLARTD